MILYAAVVLIVYNVLKHYVLSKINVKHKWILIVIAILLLFLPNVIGTAFKINIQGNPIWVYGTSALFIIFFLWFMDVSGWTSRMTKTSSSTASYSYNKKDKKKDVVIKPKAKPNRVKNRNK